MNTTTMRRSDLRGRSHPAYWAFVMHRLSGLLLALFLPLHFWALGTALRGTAGLDGFLQLTAAPLFKFAEWGLVLLLALHLAGGMRLLLIEFGIVSNLRKDLIAASLGFAAVAGLAFALSLFV